MKKYIAGLALALVLVPNSLFAYTAIGGQETLHIEQNTADNLYAAGGKVSVTGNTQGDLVLAGGELVIEGNIGDNAIVAGGSVEIKGNVQHDLMVAGGDVRIYSPVSGDIRAAGGSVKLQNSASGDVNIAGGEVDISKEAIIGKDLGLAGGLVSMNGLVQGKADIFADTFEIDGVITKDANIRIEKIGNLHIGPNAKILGKLTYQASAPIPELEKIAMGGVKYDGFPKFAADINKEGVYGFLTGYMIYQLLFLLIMGGLLLYFFGGVFKKTAAILRSSPGKSFLFGSLYIIATPVVILLCFITIIGIPLGFLSLALYIFGFVFVNVFTLVLFSELINTIWSHKITKTWHKRAIFFLIALLLTVLNGPGFILALFTFGAFMTLIGKSFAPDEA